MASRIRIHPMHDSMGKVPHPVSVLVSVCVSVCVCVCVCVSVCVCYMPPPLEADRLYMDSAPQDPPCCLFLKIHIGAPSS